MLNLSIVMPGLVPGIHVFLGRKQEDVDGRDEPGHDEFKFQTTYPQGD